MAGDRRGTTRPAFWLSLVIARWRCASSAVIEPSWPSGCDTEQWRSFYVKTRTYCLEHAPWPCMYHPLFADEAWEMLAQSVPWHDPICLQGIGAAAVIFLRDLEHRADRILSVDLVAQNDGSEDVVLALGRHHKVYLHAGVQFAPFPFGARDLVAFRWRTVQATKTVCVSATRALSAAGVAWLPWLGLLRFWAGERGAEGSDAPPDLLVPIAAEAQVLALRDALIAEGLYLYEVHPGRLVQISANGLPELGDTIDVTRVCPTCAVVNIYYLRPDRAITSWAPPCTCTEAEVSILHGLRALWLEVFAHGFIPHAAFDLLGKYGQGYFVKDHLQHPCSLAVSDFQAVATSATLGEVSASLVSVFTAVDIAAGDTWLWRMSADPVGPSNAADLTGAAKVGHHAAAKLVMGATNFSEDVGAFEGAAGWFAFMERRLAAQRPALAVFQTKVYMKKLMMERGVPIPRLIYASMDSPLLPFGPPLPQIEGGYVVKPAHLAESSHVFVIAEDGVNLLTGRRPTFEEVQGNMSLAWEHSLWDYDRPANKGKESCARSKRYAKYLQNRSCANWALYRSPPGIIIEELVKPSGSYGALQISAFRDQGLGVTWREQPDEMKCHVVWGRVFVAEWVSSDAFLGFIFRHGFVKDTIAIGPRTLEACWISKRLTGKVCEFTQLWESVVDVAERAVPPGVDYMRVDIFPNGNAPVVNELSVAGYSTMLEEWMLSEMMRRVHEGYRWRGALRDAQGDAHAAGTGSLVS